MRTVDVVHGALDHRNDFDRIAATEHRELQRHSLAFFGEAGSLPRVARLTVLAGGGVLASLLAMTAFLFIVPGASLFSSPEGVDPAQKARVLAESIAELMNCGGTALLSSFVAGLLWVFASWRDRAKVA